MFKLGNKFNRKLRRLKEPEVVERLQDCIRQQLTETGKINGTEAEWVAFRNGIVNATENEIGEVTRPIRHPWITQEILNLVDERRKYKNAINDAREREYRCLQNEVDRKCSMAKQAILGELD